MHKIPTELETLANAGGVLAYGAFDWGDMAVNVNNFPPGFDLTPVLSQVPGGSCPVPHWGYVFSGSFSVTYGDGSEETISAGDLFHLPSDHTGLRSEDGVSYVEFSPAAQQAAISEEMGKVMAQE